MDIEPRAYHDAHDLEQMKALLIAGRRAGGPTYYVHVGDLDWWLHYLLQDQDRHQSIYLWEGECADDDLSGWSLFSPRFGAFDVFVHPDQLGGERAERMWIWTEERMAALVATQGGDELCTMWVSEHDAALITLLERRGFSRSAFHHVYMTRALEGPIPAPALPPGYRVRHVLGESEATQRAAVSHAAFESHAPFERYDQHYRAFMGSSAYTPELDLVVETPDGRFGAFCICWLDGVNRVGLFEPVGTGPEWRRKGLGRAVLAEGLRRMQARGMWSAVVCVDYDNPAAQRLYAALGFQAVHKILTFTKGF
jgi:mycothiol synthase